jgi:hypothetical protein
MSEALFDRVRRQALEQELERLGPPTDPQLDQAAQKQQRHRTDRCGAEGGSDGTRTRG